METKEHCNHFYNSSLAGFGHSASLAQRTDKLANEDREVHLGHSGGGLLIASAVSITFHWAKGVMKNQMTLKRFES